MVAYMDNIPNLKNSPDQALRVVTVDWRLEASQWAEELLTAVVEVLDALGGAHPC